MKSVSDLQNSITELQSMLINGIDPVFSDLQNSSHILNSVIASQTAITQKMNELIVAIPILSLLIENDIIVDAGFSPSPADTTALIP